MCRCFTPWCLQARPYCQSELGSIARALWQRQVHDQADEPSPYTNVIETVASWNSEHTFIHITSTICSPMWKSDIAWHKALIPSNPWEITKDILENNQLDRSISCGHLRIYEDTWGYMRSLWAGTRSKFSWDQHVIGWGLARIGFPHSHSQPMLLWGHVLSQSAGHVFLDSTNITVHSTILR